MSADVVAPTASSSRPASDVCGARPSHAAVTARSAAQASEGRAFVDALIDRTEKEGYDEPTSQALAHLASTDSNPYVRLKCANAVMKSGK